MKTESEEAIKALAKKGGESGKADEALKFTQAALNLAHVLDILKSMENRNA